MPRRVVTMTTVPPLNRNLPYAAELAASAGSLPALPGSAAQSAETSTSVPMTSATARPVCSASGSG